MAFAASLPFQPARPRRSWRARFRSTLLDLVTATRDRLIAWQADDYTQARGTEPVVDVVTPGVCWTITGRHGRVLVSTTLPIWDVDGIPADMTDEDVVERITSALYSDPSALEHLTETDRFRIYRTAAGARVICSTRPVDLRDADDWTWFAGIGQLLGADDVYMRCCQRQFTCRARLDPKLHRLAELNLPKAEARACRLISDELDGSEFARDTISHHPDLMEQVRFHDSESRAIYDHTLPLA